MVHDKRMERRLFSHPSLFCLFGVYLLGVAFGTSLVSETNTVAMVPTYRQSVFSGASWCAVYYGLILLMSRTPGGVLLIPLGIGFRGFIYGTAVSALIQTGTWTKAALVRLCIPAVFYLTGLFYWAALGLSLSVCRIRKQNQRRETMKAFKRGFLFAVISAGVGVLTDLMLNIS